MKKATLKLDRKGANLEVNDISLVEKSIFTSFSVDEVDPNIDRGFD